MPRHQVGGQRPMILPTVVRLHPLLGTRSSPVAPPNEPTHASPGGIWHYSNTTLRQMVMADFLSRLPDQGHGGGSWLTLGTRPALSQAVGICGIRGAVV